MSLSASDIIITNGSQQALYLIADCLIDPGDIVIAANPTYYVYSAGLASLGANIQTVPMDSDGIDVDALEKLLERFEIEKRLDRVKLIYCTSYYQNPTGLTLSLPRRRRLLELAKSFSRKHRILILEDAAYRELRYGGPALPSIKSFDTENQFTILAQTFSKPFAPGLKTGYTVMPADLMHMVLRQKGNHDFGSNNLSQHILLEAMNNGFYEEQVRRLCENYRRKRDAMLAALNTHFPEGSGANWTRPEGGLYVWLTLRPDIDASRNGPLFSKAIEHGVLYVPGDYCFQPDAIGRIPRNHLRLSFGQVAPEKIEPGIASLAAAVAEVSNAAVPAGI
jgi:2-aminoadipate transaminase